MNSARTPDLRAARASATPDRRRWLILGTVGLAQLMVVLDATIVNIALPSAQRALGFTTVDRQWVVTAYALAFGSLLLFGGRLGDLIGRKITFLVGALGFAAASAVGGAATSFGMLVAARAFQGAFGALLAPAALSILSTTFSDPKERGKAFGVYGAIVGAGGAIGLVLGGILTEYLSWRWCLYVNLIFAGLAGDRSGAAAQAAARPHQDPAGPARRRARLGLDVLPGLRVLQRRHPQLAHAVHLRLPGRGRGAARRVRALAVPRGQPAAAAPGGARPQPRRRLPGRADHRRGHVRHLLVPHLLHAADPGLLPGGQRRRLPADDRDGGGGRQPVQRGAAAPARPQAAGHRRHAAGRGQPGVADQDRRALGLRIGGARPADGGRPGLRLHDRAVDEHRHVRRGAAGRGRGLGHAQHRPADRRLDRHLAAQHDLRQRGGAVPDQPPEPGHPGPRAPGAVPGRDVADPRLHHRVLGRGGHLRRRRGDLRHAVPPRPAPRLRVRGGRPGRAGRAAGRHRPQGPFSSSDRAGWAAAHRQPTPPVSSDNHPNVHTGPEGGATCWQLRAGTATSDRSCSSERSQR